MKPTRKDFPLAETQPERVRGARGKALSEITLDAVLSGAVTIDDLRITPQALEDQASIARSSGRLPLADNFLRASELVAVPQETIMEVYELLRPGRASDKAQLLEAAAMMRERHGADRIAAFIEEAADTYETRGLFKRRF